MTVYPITKSFIILLCNDTDLYSLIAHCLGFKVEEIHISQYEFDSAL